MQLKLILLVFCTLFGLQNCDDANQPVNYKDWLINLAINDGYQTIDNYLRTTFWYYLKGSNLLDYRVKVNTTSLNYRIIYMGTNGIFLVNTALDKIKWEVSINNFVKINADIVQYY